MKIIPVDIHMEPIPIGGLVTLYYSPNGWEKIEVLARLTYHSEDGCACDGPWGDLEVVKILGAHEGVDLSLVAELVKDLSFPWGVFMGWGWVEGVVPEVYVAADQTMCIQAHHGAAE